MGTYYVVTEYQNKLHVRNSDFVKWFIRFDFDFNPTFKSIRTFMYKFSVKFCVMIEVNWSGTLISTLFVDH